MEHDNSTPETNEKYKAMNKISRDIYCISAAPLIKFIRLAHAAGIHLNETRGNISYSVNMDIHHVFSITMRRFDGLAVAFEEHPSPSSKDRIKIHLRTPVDVLKKDKTLGEGFWFQRLINMYARLIVKYQDDPRLGEIYPHLDTSGIFGQPKPKPKSTRNTRVRSDGIVKDQPKDDALGTV